MPRPRRLGPIAVVLAVYDVWRRLPTAQRRQILDASRKHGPRLASQALKRARRRPPGA